MSLKLWKFLSVRIKVEDHNGKIHWYDESDCNEHDIAIEWDIEDIINKQGGTFDEEEVGKSKTPKHWTAKAWAEHMLHISGFTDIKEVKSVQSNTRRKVSRKSNKSKQSSEATV